MKWLASIICVALLGHSSFAQGLVKFANTSTTLISYDGGPNGLTVLPPRAGTLGTTFYFALLSAPVGTWDRSAFQFTGLYATNTTTASGGRIQGGSLLGVPCNGTWPANATRDFFVVGWSAFVGPTWNQNWLVNPPPNSMLGVSQIATGTTGGTDPITGLTYPALALWSGLTLQNGFVLGMPEPTSISLIVLGAAFMLFSRRK